MRRPQPPRSEAELSARADALAGRTLGAVSGELGLAIPPSTRRGKGWAGVVLETALGATAASLPEPDFQLIGVELKTVPVGARGRPLESTYVCTVPPDGGASPHWIDSLVRRKLARVLWVPVEGDRALALADRRIGTALLWSPAPEEEAALRADWEEHMERVALGRADEISARDGACLQIRPKAANARARRASVGADGERVPTLPRGFYLRASFTAGVLARHYAL